MFSETMYASLLFYAHACAMVLFSFQQKYNCRFDKLTNYFSNKEPVVCFADLK